MNTDTIVSIFIPTYAVAATAFIALFAWRPTMFHRTPKIGQTWRVQMQDGWNGNEYGKQPPSKTDRKIKGIVLKKDAWGRTKTIIQLIDKDFYCGCRELELSDFIYWWTHVRD